MLQAAPSKPTGLGFRVYFLVGIGYHLRGLPRVPPYRHCTHTRVSRINIFYVFIAIVHFLVQAVGFRVQGLLQAAPSKPAGLGFRVCYRPHQAPAETPAKCLKVGSVPLKDPEWFRV